MKKIVLMGLLIAGMSLGFTGCKQSDSLTSSDISILSSKSEEAAKSAQCITLTIHGARGVSSYEIRGEQSYKYKGNLGLSSSGIRVKNTTATPYGYKCTIPFSSRGAFQKGTIYPGQTVSCIKDGVLFDSCSSWRF